MVVRLVFGVWCLVVQLMMMGFPEDAAKAALAEVGGDFMAAMEKLFG
jgi:uncharacterized UBP type Zn finger protein